jgi:RNA polymerase sigma-70 factor (ECF subfamily)
VVNVDSGYRRGYDELFRESGPTLIRAVYAYTGGRRDIAEDAVAEAFARALAKDGQIRDPLPWLYRVSLRIAAQETKRERDHPMVDLPAPAEGGAGGLGRVLTALRELSPNQRAAIVLHYEADLPVREVARLLGISGATVKVHLHRGRKKLRVLLGDEEVQDD